MDGEFVKEDFWFFIVHCNKLVALLCYHPRKNPNREVEFRAQNFQQGRLNVFESGGAKMFTD